MSTSAATRKACASARRTSTSCSASSRRSKARFDVGEITRTDVAQSRGAPGRRPGRCCQSAGAQLAISRANYAAVVGQNPGDLAPEPSLASLLPANVDEAFDVAEQNNPQLRAQQFAEQASRARVAGARAERMPTVSLQRHAAASAATRRPASTATSIAATSPAAATVTVPLFTGGLTSSRIRQPIERNNADRIAIETAAPHGAAERHPGLEPAARRPRQHRSPPRSRCAPPRIAAEGTRQEQQVGLRTTLDVLNAEQELRNAELAQVSARRDEYVAAATVLAAMGRLEAQEPDPGRHRSTTRRPTSGKLRITWGWVPWEEPIAVVDRALAAPPIPATRGRRRPSAPIAAGPAAAAGGRRRGGCACVATARKLAAIEAAPLRLKMRLGWARRIHLIARRPAHVRTDLARTDDGGDPRLHPPHHLRRRRAGRRRPRRSRAGRGAGAAPAPEPEPAERRRARAGARCDRTRRRRRAGAEPRRPLEEDERPGVDREGRDPRRPRRLQPARRAAAPPAARRAGAVGELWSASARPPPRPRPSASSRRRSPMPTGGRTLEDVVRELLRPLLQQWLDENLPAHRPGRPSRPKSSASPAAEYASAATIALPAGGPVSEAD